MAEDPTHSAAGHRGLITVFGGTGFLGRRIVRHLLDHRFQVRAASRHPERVGSAPRADAGPETTKADIRDETTVAAALFGAYGAVNAVRLYVERGRETFDAVHVEAAARVARLAREGGVERLIHVSGIAPIRLRLRRTSPRAAEVRLWFSRPFPAQPSFARLLCSGPMTPF
jgi:uncharacterized protein YbjT (DUF2867 family)